MTFTQKVYAVTGSIPRGKVATYAQIARLAGNANASRAVGMAMRRNTDRNKVPCHRVVGSDGKLTGYAFGKGIQTKRKMLQEEGVLFKEQKVLLSRSQWNA